MQRGRGLCWNYVTVSAINIHNGNQSCMRPIYMHGIIYPLIQDMRRLILL